MHGNLRGSSLLAVLMIGQGSPRRLELDGSGGAWIATEDDVRTLRHFDAVGSPITTIPIPVARDIAFDHQGARAYLLRQDDTGIDVIPL